ncbi:HEPN domain-containing protein [Flavihumibacter sp. UBA7668]|uniref:HEPN domain-containing protein n=1 Tax=Flavihumibacter sp. UBA7668 TaxID=1946542 RepID=UPI0025C0D80C|nr:HEPN domain-containing protein [Flavihumibacter sp. UBA7668]
MQSSVTRNAYTQEIHPWNFFIPDGANKLLLGTFPNEDIMPVTTLVLQTSTFVEWLQRGLPFAMVTWQQAPVLYDAGSIGREVIWEPNEKNNSNESTKQWEEGLTKAKEFLAGSELYRIRKQHKMAAFMLHQSAEQALRTLLKVGTGYHANTHSIDRLLRYGSLVSYQLS